MKHPDPQVNAELRLRVEALLKKLIAPKPSLPHLNTIDLSLDRITALLAALGNPERKIPPVIHVAGTNGKGSLIAYLTAILKAAGLRVHRYISPHLVRFNERIMVAGSEIHDAELLNLLSHVEAYVEKYPATFFEATTAVAFLAFAGTPADIVLLETGLGGRLDATNVLEKPHLTAITPISMDHTEYMGDVLSLIALEKAGIIKPGVPCIIGPQVVEAAQVLEKMAFEKSAPLMRFGQEWTVAREEDGFRYRSETHDLLFPLPNLVGAHQIANAGTAIACALQLDDFEITKDHIATGITHAHWPARLQHLTEGRLASAMPAGSDLWLDGGHNPGAGEVLAVWAAAQKKPVHLICGMLKVKDAQHFLEPLAPYVKSLTAVEIEGEPQSQDPAILVQAAVAAGIQKTQMAVGNDFKSAIESIVNAEKNDITILMCGSLYLAGNILWQNG